MCSKRNQKLTLAIRCYLIQVQYQPKAPRFDCQGQWTNDVALCAVCLWCDIRCSSISLKITTVQNVPLSSSYFIWWPFRQVNHVYSLDLVIYSAKVGCAHYELFSLCCPVLPSSGEISSPFNTVWQVTLPHLLCFEGSQTDFYVPVFFFHTFEATTGFQSYSKLCIKDRPQIVYLGPCFLSLTPRLYKLHFEDLVSQEGPFILWWQQDSDNECPASWNVVSKGYNAASTAASSWIFTLKTGNQDDKDDRSRKISYFMTLIMWNQSLDPLCSLSETIWIAW